MTVLLKHGLMYGCVAPKLVRNVALGLLKIEHAEIEDVSLLLGVPVREALQVWEGLVADGWIIQQDGQWVASEHIRTLANARIGKPLQRAKADTLLAQLLQNAADLNKLPTEIREIFWVTRVAVFGSYLEDTTSLGDLDIAIDYEGRMGSENWALQMMMYGKDSESPTRGRLIPRSPYIKTISFDTLKKLDCPYKVLYTFEPPK
ncbi:hypothetical protein [Chromobacterium haemolyticum]|uniref:hypothetical protein n=1 Tax=Chromobacterium haemolyticum TaxID=394935 RepID=UPI002447918C|nr:hypothetical protein [Chromobacterium haemolyticum]MDH0341977.1 nucleotidyltransferase domain-containing protein [Chromobacterium haemolyticum]